MIALLKYLGKGVLTIVLLPFIVVYYAIMLVFQLLQFFIYGSIGIIKFFRGKNFKNEDEIATKYNELYSTPKIVTNTITNISNASIIEDEEIEESEDDDYDE